MMLEIKTREDAAKLLLENGWKLEQVTDVLRGRVQLKATQPGYEMLLQGGTGAPCVKCGATGLASCTTLDCPKAFHARNIGGMQGVASGGITSSVMPSSSGVPSGLAREIGRLAMPDTAAKSWLQFQVETESSSGVFEPFVPSDDAADICPQCGDTGWCMDSQCPMPGAPLNPAARERVPCAQCGALDYPNCPQSNCPQKPD